MVVAFSISISSLRTNITAFTLLPPLSTGISVGASLLVLLFLANSTLKGVSHSIREFMT